ncbi:putative aldouronate transport system substrate-binding protein [Paenibacillus taihuensis]|uniref:Putative aldouronate transport system substrate-binding protein n=1 Tax=Paenibacillus taihuensis TaxID=1156355 RepID=A0A3D9S1U1_9BACL|nr:extracellular solute-binding protein [Paenibacillus taihuensis]REE86546.1 putative aldouronate transport system substrate-binding protein [Paenibacillus taihuensis]
MNAGTVKCSRKVLLSLVLCASVIQMTACQRSGEKSPGKVVNEPPISIQYPTTTTNNEAINNKKTAITETPITLTVFVDMPWFWVDSFTGPIPEELTKRTGVKLKIIRSTDENQLPSMLARGDLPDMIYSDRLADRLANKTTSYAWDSLINAYTPKFEISDEEKRLNASSDGHFYTIRNFYRSEADMDNPYAVADANTAALAIRDDIMKQLGNPPLNSLTDLEHILLRVKAEHPDMIPLLLDEISHWSAYFKERFGVDGMYLHDGKVQSQLRNPKLLDYYLFLNRLYREGLIQPENFTFNHEQYMEKRDSGEAFAFIRNVYDANAANSAYQAAGIHAHAKLITSPLSDSFQHVNDTVGLVGTYVTKKSRYPDVAIKLLQYLRSEEGQRLMAWGIEGVHWHMSKEGYPVFDPQYRKDKYESFDKWVQKYGVAAWTFGVHGNIANLAAYDKGQPEVMEALRIEKAHTVYDSLLARVNPPSDSAEAKIAAEVKKLISGEQTKVILADTEESSVAQYNLMVSKAEALGLSKVEDWMSKKYAAISKE